MNILQNYVTNNGCYQQHRTRTPIGIQVHSIGVGQGTAQVLANYWNQNIVEACVHYVVDADTPGKVLQLLPESYTAWADAGWANRAAITIEMCESDYIKYVGGASYTVSDEAAFRADFLRAYETLVELCADICKRYGWDPTDKLPNGLYVVSSHNEGRLAGLSSSHVDPEHIFSHFGYTMDRLRQDISDRLRQDIADKLRQDIKEMANGEKANVSPVYYYRVRKSWEDKDSQIGAYEILENAKKNCPLGYGVYDEDGQEIYRAESTPIYENTDGDKDTADDVNTIINEEKDIDKIWMGWVRRESGDLGFRCVFGDAGKAWGKYQFDYRYGLIPFLKFCVAYSPERYDRFNTFIAYENDKEHLVNNPDLAIAWRDACDNYPEEFEALQDYVGYTSYYLEAKKYIKNLYGIEMDDHGPAVKGTLWSMAIRSGALSAAKKFEGCTNETSDEEMLRVSYGTYGTGDKGRWTEKAQYGDALAALKSGEYDAIRIINVEKDEPEKPYYYRVGSGWNGSGATNQIGAYTSLDSAIAMAKWADLSVYDEEGNKVYPVSGYRVQCGVYNLYDNAMNMVAKIKNAGFNGMIKEFDGQFIAQAGIFNSEAYANEYADRIRKAGLPVAVISI